MTVDLYQTPLRYGEAYDELSADGVNPRAHLGTSDRSLRAIGPEELGRRCFQGKPPSSRERHYLQHLRGSLLVQTVHGKSACRPIF